MEASAFGSRSGSKITAIVLHGDSGPAEATLARMAAPGAKTLTHYYLARELEQDPDLPVGLIWADQDAGGTHVNISGGGITKYAKNPELAQDFLEWLGTDGQSVLVDSNHEFPASTEATPEPLITEEFGLDFKRQTLDAKQIGELNPDAEKLMDEAGFG